MSADVPASLPGPRDSASPPLTARDVLATVTRVGFPLESLELVEASIEPGFVHAYTLRCRACGHSVTTRSEPMRFPVLPSDLGGPG